MPARGSLARCARHREYNRGYRTHCVSEPLTLDPRGRRTTCNISFVLARARSAFSPARKFIERRDGKRKREREIVSRQLRETSLAGKEGEQVKVHSHLSPINPMSLKLANFSKKKKELD